MTWFGVLAMFSGSRRRNASKCKRLVNRLKNRIKIQKTRRSAIMRHARSDIAHLLHNGQYRLALSKAGQLHRDQCRLAAYNQLEEFCDQIMTDFSKQSKFSDEAKDIASSMIYASTRCGELPELRSLRDLFKHHFGQPFDKTNIELLPGNRVNMQIKKNLSREPIMEDVMLQLTNDIANEYATSLDPQFKSLAHDIYIAPCESEKREEHWESINNDALSYRNKRALKLQGILQRIRSNFTSTREDVTSNSPRTSSLSIQGKRIVSIGERRVETHHVEGLSSSSKSYTQKVRDQRCNFMKPKDDVSYIRKDRITSKDSYGVNEEKKTHITHVHPKLPDYETLVAKFMDIKRQTTNQNKPLTRWMRW